MSLTITDVIKDKKSITKYFRKCERDLEKLETFRVF
jgi:hypothetical protein